MVDGCPRLTVGMPVYNDPEGLRRTIPCVFGQTWRGPIRLLVVDDGSTDDTPQVLEELRDVYGRIDVVRNPENRGRPFARNTILEHAQDDYLAWIDAGDLWHPRKLELQLDSLRAHERADPSTPLLSICAFRWYFFDRDEERHKTPHLGGDQLYNALVGTLYPYLATLLGRAEHYRAVGGFDERLLRRQDYDFLVRFLAEGGRIVGVADDTPMWTYLKSDVGASARVVTASNRVIRKKHAPYYERYGRETAWLVRSKQHRLVARFRRHNGQRVRAAGHMALAKVLDPELPRAWASVLRRVFGGLRRAVGVAVRPLVRLLMPLMPALRRSGATSLARRVGVTRLLEAAGVMRVFYGESKRSGTTSGSRDRNDVTTSDGPSRSRVRGARHPVLLQARKLLSEDVYTEAIARLEEATTAEGAPVPVDVWLLLERAYREDGALDAAKSALDRGLAANPEDGRLRVRLVELLSLQRDWAACVGLWSQLADEDHEYRTALTYHRVARSLRMLGDPTAAFKVAADGVRRWPRDRRLLDELYVNRASLVDWKAAVVGPPELPADVAQEPAVGRVTDLGFLLGDDRPVSGWVDAEQIDGEVSGSAKVSIHVNGLAVATTGAAPDRGARDGELAFSLSCHDLLKYLGDGDIISFECEGRALDVSDVGDRCVVITGYSSRFPELYRRLQDGYVFTKFGELRRGNDPRRTDEILQLYEEVGSILADAHGLLVFPFYGNLLGAIREHDLIEHDVGGFDMGYVSSQQTPEAVRREFLRVCRTLLDAGFHLTLEPWSTYIRRRRRDPLFVDLNYAWFTASGDLQMSFGWRYQPVTDRERLFYPRRSPIGGHLVRVPGNAEEVLDQIYGPTWPIPDQGFELDVELKRDPEFLVTEDELRSLKAEAPERVRLRSAEESQEPVPPTQSDARTHMDGASVSGPARRGEASREEHGPFGDKEP